MPRGLFITGSDTNVGKTAVAAAFMHRYRPHVRLRYWKPIQTGIEQDDDTATVRRLGSCSDEELFTQGYRLRGPVSPHLAAQRNQVRIRPLELENHLAGQGDSRFWIIEGAGGVLVPINEFELIIDLMVRLDMPVVVAARTTLGTINHTLLTLDAIRNRGLKVGGVVMVGNKDPENRNAIEAFGRAAILGEMPFFADLTAASLRDWASKELDPQNELAGWMK